MFLKILIFITIGSLLVKSINAKFICVSAAVAYGTVSSETGCEVGYGIANLLGLEHLLGIPLCVLVGFIESLVPVLQGLLAFFIPICVTQFPPVDDGEKSYISETVSITNGYELGLLLGGPLLGPFLGFLLTICTAVEVGCFHDYSKDSQKFRCIVKNIVQ